MVQLATHLSEDEQVLGNLRLDLLNYTASVGDRPVDLAFYEFELLRVLCRDAGRILGYDALCRALWGSYGEKERRRLGVTVFRLRSRLDGSRPYRLETVRGRGYGLIAPHTLREETGPRLQPVAAAAIMV